MTFHRQTFHRYDFSSFYIHNISYTHLFIDTTLINDENTHNIENDDDNDKYSDNNDNGDNV